MKLTIPSLAAASDAADAWQVLAPDLGHDVVPNVREAEIVPFVEVHPLGGRLLLPAVTRHPASRLRRGVPADRRASTFFWPARVEADVMTQLRASVLAPTPHVGGPTTTAALCTCDRRSAPNQGSRAARRVVASVRAAVPGRRGTP